jgi:protoporphyrinogen oxidase
MTPRRRAIIIGAGPAGLTAAWEMLDRTDILPIVLEASGELGGLARTVEHRGNRIDIGGHRFFSKSERVMQWRQNILPLQGAPARDDILLGRPVPVARDVSRRALRAPAPVSGRAPDPEREDRVLLRRGRISRIFFRRRFFDYPLSIDYRTLANLGFWRACRIGLSYARTRLRLPREERSLEDFLINRFGAELYRTFFRDYTEKVWGVPCDANTPEWGAQRIKGLSVGKVLRHALRPRPRRGDSLAQKTVETSLIEESDVLDQVVIRVPDTYPAYFGTYDRFAEIRAFTDGIANLFLIGRNGMHRYNNQDHSMHAAIAVVDNLIAGRADKQNIWDVNAEAEYHEEKS